MRQILNSNTYPDFPNLEINYHKKVELFMDSFSGYDAYNNSFKILYVKEAEAISHFRKHAIENSHLFDAIITYDKEILNSCKNSYFLTFGTTWIHDYEFKEKKFQISHLTGHKNTTEGHNLRQKIHYKQELIKTPKDFYISKYGGVENFANNKILGDNKNQLFDSQFHICIENSREDNYFTEKIIDCFVTKTIPIYWGCPNIDNWFDLNGIIVVNNLKDIIETCNGLTEDIYYKKINAIGKNLDLSKKHATINDRLIELIKKILSNNGNIQKNN